MDKIEEVKRKIDALPPGAKAFNCVFAYLSAFFIACFFFFAFTGDFVRMITCAFCFCVAMGGCHISLEYMKDE